VRPNDDDHRGDRSWRQREAGSPRGPGLEL